MKKFAKKWKKRKYGRQMDSKKQRTENDRNNIQEDRKYEKELMNIRKVGNEN